MSAGLGVSAEADARGRPSVVTVWGLEFRRSAPGGYVEFDAPGGCVKARLDVRDAWRLECAGRGARAVAVLAIGYGDEGSEADAGRD